MKKGIFIVGIVGFSIASLWAQLTVIDPDKGPYMVMDMSESSDTIHYSGTIHGDDVFFAVEQQAEFPGGQQALMKWLAQNIQYPTDAVINEIEGRVVLRFIVEKDGSIGDVDIVKGVDPSLDAEAVRVVSTMPRWEPGRNGGEPVRSYFNIPILFKLNDGIRESVKNEEIDIANYYDTDAAAEFERMGDEEASKGNVKYALMYYKEAFDICPMSVTALEKSEKLLEGDKAGLAELYKNAVAKFMREEELPNGLPDGIFIIPAQNYLEKLVAVDPDNIDNKKFLIGIYSYIGDKDNFMKLAEELYPYFGDITKFSTDQFEALLSDYAYQLYLDGDYDSVIEKVSPFETQLLESLSPEYVSMVLYIYAKSLNEKGKKKEAEKISKKIMENASDSYDQLVLIFGEL